MRRFLWLTLAVLATTTAFCVVTLPPPAVALAVTVPPTTAAGAYHIHTTRSDGSGSVDDVARAAAQAGLQFVIITDHLTARNAAVLPAAPEYRHGVLVIDAMEVSTDSGHLVALGLREPAPYPLGGEARDVIEDVHRLGGWTVAAHPDSPKPDLRWRGRATEAIEWINADSEWRDNHSPGRLLQAALHSVSRPAAAVASLFSRPEASIERWDRWGRTGHIVGIAAVDAHARIGIDEQREPKIARTVLARPSYADMFRTLVQAVWLDQPLGGDAAVDAGRVLAALRAGRTYSAVTAIAVPAVLTVTHDAGMLRARAEGAPLAIVSIWRNGREVAAAAGDVSADCTMPGLYRVEVRWPGVDVPWIVSAPHFVASAAPSERPAAPIPAGASIRLPADGPWTIEHHPASQAAWRTDGALVEFTFALAPGASSGQYAALVSPLDATRSLEEIRFTVVADRPRRFSVQVRLPDNSRGGERWVRSVYADTNLREVRVRLEDFEPAGRPTTRRPVAARLQSLLFVVDAPHTVPGAQGWIRLSGVSLVGPADDPVTSGR